MNKSYSKIRHMQQSNLLLEQRLLEDVNTTTDLGAGSSFPPEAYDYIDSLSSLGFDIVRMPVPTQANLKDIKVYLQRMRCENQKHFGVYVYTNDGIYQGCKGSNESLKMINKDYKPGSVTGKNPKDYYGEKQKNKVINKDISVIITDLAKLGKINY
jgi:hypothetical protein